MNNKTTLLGPDGRPLPPKAPEPFVHDVRGEWLDGDNKGDLVLKRTQEVDDEFWEVNKRIRDEALILGPGHICPAVRMPTIIEERLHTLYPHVDPAKGAEKGQRRVREVIRLLRLMGEERCITTPWTI